MNKEERWREAASPSAARKKSSYWSHLSILLSFQAEASDSWKRKDRASYSRMRIGLSHSWKASYFLIVKEVMIFIEYLPRRSLVQLPRKLIPRHTYAMLSDWTTCSTLILLGGQDSYPKAYPILCSLTPLAVSWSCFDPVFFFWLNVPYLDSVEKLLCSDPLPRPAWSPSPLLIQLTRLNEGLGISRLILTSETQESIGTSSRLLRTA